MTLDELVTEYAATRAPGWVVLHPAEMLQCGIEATRYYAGYGDIKSLSGSDPLPGAAGSATPIVYPQPAPVDFTFPTPETPYVLPSTDSGTTSTDPVIADALPIKDLGLITKDTVLSVGEWTVIRPLFWLYVERENAQRLEASRALGLEVYGRSVSEIAGDISVMERETLPADAFVAVAIEV